MRQEVELTMKITLDVDAGISTPNLETLLDEGLTIRSNTLDVIVVTTDIFCIREESEIYTENSIVSPMNVKEIEALKNSVLEDERLSYPDADIMINAPLALEQLIAKTKVETLEKVLGLPLTNFETLKR